MRKEITIKENGKVIKKVFLTVPDKEHFESQIKYPHKVVENKKKYNRKKYKKNIDIE